MTERTACLVPFCRRTTKGDPRFTEWICCRHWPGVPRPLKERLRKAKRIWRRRQTPASRRLCDLIWARCKEAAIASAGVS